MTASMHPGMVLGGRYQLDDLLTDLDGARFWRATDQVLARTVAIHVLRSDDPRTPGVLEAARITATLTEPHLLKVLDVGVGDEFTWVVNEWGTGASLDVLTADGPLPPDRAAWFVREVAEALAVVHAEGHAHGRLAPENVMVIDTGSVKLIGFGLEAALKTPDLDRANAVHRDVRDLGGLLHCALTGCWAGVSESAVRQAPTDSRGPLRPRKIRAGIPGPLDQICERVLGRGGEWALTSAHDIASALGAYAGDVPPLEPVMLPGRAEGVMPVTLRPTEGLAGGDLHHDDPAADGDDGRPEDEGADDGAAEGAAEDGGAADGAADDEVAPTTAVPRATGAAAVPTVAVPAAGEDDVADDEPGPHSDDASEPTRALAPGRLPEHPPEPDPAFAPEDDRWEPGDDPHDELESTQRVAPVSRVADEDPVPERPLFAPEGTRRNPKAHARLSPAAFPSQERAEPPPPPEPMTDTGWPFHRDDGPAPVDRDEAGPPWWRWPLLIGALVLLVVGVITLVQLPGDESGPPSADPSPSASPSAPPTSGPLRIRQVTDLDPEGDPPEENPELAGDAADGDRSTAWRTLTYRNRPDLGGLKSGVGLVVDLGRVQQVSRVRVDLVGRGTSLTLYAARPDAERPTGVDGLEEVASATDAGTRVNLRLAQPPRTRFLVVWLISLPPADGGYRGEISEITAFS